MICNFFYLLRVLHAFCLRGFIVIFYVFFSSSEQPGV